MLNQQHIKPVTSRVVIHIQLDDRRNGDCANREKAVSDLLVQHGILKDDSKKHVKGVNTHWERVDECVVTLEPVDDWQPIGKVASGLVEKLERARE